MHSRVVFTDVDVEFQRLFLQEGHIKVINFILERELCLVVRLKSFSHLGGLSSVIVEVKRAERDQGSNVNTLHHILVEFSVLDLKVQDVLILEALGLVCHS
jgi:hypothetical protein